jgi:desulfoferrodoxin (superoxide reductase-like protein)
MKKTILYPLMAICALAMGCNDSSQAWFSGKDEDSLVPENKRYHTSEKPGIWEGRENEHQAVVTFTSKNTIMVTVPLLPSAHPKHYIELIALMKGEHPVEIRRFGFDKKMPAAAFTLQDPSAQDYWISVKCNNHGLWKTALPENPYGQ